MLVKNLNDQLSIILVKGADSKKFLQGQLTNDINQLDGQNFQLTAHLNNKGRILASFIITKPAENTYYLITPSEIVANILPRLKMFVLRAQVTIDQLNLNVIFSNKKLSQNTIIEFTHEYFLTLTESTMDNASLEEKEWKNFLIKRGIPLIYSQTQGLFLPQHVNYDLLEGVNFKKGCYTGQEIVARTHYLGKVKRRMYRFICDFEAAIGQAVVSPKLDNQEIGVIVEVVKRDHNYLGLVSLQLDCIEEAFLDTANTQQLLIQSIEYGK
jgi:folate-binding protein YgfZ